MSGVVGNAGSSNAVYVQLDTDAPEETNGGFLQGIFDELGKSPTEVEIQKLRTKINGRDYSGMHRVAYIAKRVTAAAFGAVALVGSIVYIEENSKQSFWYLPVLTVAGVGGGFYYDWKARKAMQALSDNKAAAEAHKNLLRKPARKGESFANAERVGLAEHSHLTERFWKDQIIENKLLGDDPEIYYAFERLCELRKSDPAKAARVYNDLIGAVLEREVDQSRENPERLEALMESVQLRHKALESINEAENQDFMGSVSESHWRAMVSLVDALGISTVLDFHAHPDWGGAGQGLQAPSGEPPVPGALQVQQPQLQDGGAASSIASSGGDEQFYSCADLGDGHPVANQVDSQ